MARRKAFRVRSDRKKRLLLWLNENFDRIVEALAAEGQFTAEDHHAADEMIATLEELLAPTKRVPPLDRLGHKA
jgi:hypothetical protein